MDFLIGKGRPCFVELGDAEPEAVRLAAENLKADLEKVFGKGILCGEKTGAAGIRIRTLKKGQERPGEHGRKGASDGRGEERDCASDGRGAERGCASDGRRAECDCAPDGCREERDCASDGRRAECESLPAGNVRGENGVLSAYSGELWEDNGGLRREAYSLCVREGILYITGTDRRGTIYGVYEVCERMGVSPWYFWADVPVKKKEEYLIPEGYEYCDHPSVEYRGIFINDEEELEAWAKSHMGEESIGVGTYEKVFELLLRLKANYIWPAMHVNSFNMKRENGALAERMGIVVGTSHCDMLMRSNNREWRPWLAKKGYEGARYDYSLPGRNREILQEYWRESVEQNKDFEVCYTLGMRGIHDSGFETGSLKGLAGEELKAAKIGLLQQVMEDQQKILKETLGRDTMMTFIPYKEVLPLYDGGLEVPEDITLVWANDNYGYIRRYPSEKEKKRRGGNGIYYHNSYWAPPGMSYVFLCSIPLAHTANELRKAYAEGVRKLWVINTGAMKPLEQEIEFFLRLGWDIGKNIRKGNGIEKNNTSEAGGESAFGESEKFLTEDVDVYVENWINRNFSGGIGKETAAILNDFSQLTNVRKLEMMDYGAFSQTAYGDEAVVRIHVYEDLFARGNRLYAGLPEEEKAAFFQLVLMRIHAAYFTNLAYYYGDRSTLMYHQGKMQAAGAYVRKVRALEDARRRMLVYYNQKMLDGKWNHILDPEGFPPPRAAMMPVCTPPLNLGDTGLVVTLWNREEPLYAGGAAREGALTFTGWKVKWLEVGNAGRGGIEFALEAPEWIGLSQTEGIVETERRILIWPKNVGENRQGVITITEKRTGSRVEVPVYILAVCGGAAQNIAGAEADAARQDAAEIEGSLRKPCAAGPGSAAGPRRAAESAGSRIPVEDDGMTAVEADTAQSPCFKKIKRLGRGCGSLMECCAAEGLEEGKDSRGNYMEDRAAACAEERFRSAGAPLRYRAVFITEGEFLLEIHRFPSLNSTGRIRIGVSVDDGPVKIVETEANDEHRGRWRENVRDNVDRLYLKLPYLTAGEHTISFHAVDKYFAFTRFVVYTKERRENNYAGVLGCQALPAEFDAEKFAEDFYGRIPLLPRAVEYACPEKEKDTLAVTDLIRQDGAYGAPVEPEWILQSGRDGFREREGCVCIDCGAALAQSPHAYTAGEGWEHCASESYGRSGIAMYIRTWDKTEGSGEACCVPPSLNYRFTCEGGGYTIWMLARFGRKEESYFSAGLDQKELSKEELYHGGCLWRYEAEQIYRYVPVGSVELSKGEHLLTIYAKAPGLRFDRICLLREGVPVEGGAAEEGGLSKEENLKEGGGEFPLGRKLPPMDSVWREYRA